MSEETLNKSKLADVMLNYPCRITVGDKLSVTNSVSSSGLFFTKEIPNYVIFDEHGDEIELDASIALSREDSLKLAYDIIKLYKDHDDLGNTNNG